MRAAAAAAVVDIVVDEDVNDAVVVNVMEVLEVPVEVEEVVVVLFLVVDDCRLRFRCCFGDGLTCLIEDRALFVRDDADLSSGGVGGRPGIFTFTRSDDFVPGLWCGVKV